MLLCEYVNTIMFTCQKMIFVPDKIFEDRPLENYIVLELKIVP